ncbi:MAG: hypothetical protein GY842_00600, partial [bacterium]|nr:hypothetical protein [bacterium]
MSRRGCSLWIAVLYLSSLPLVAEGVDPALLAGIEARLIGPAGMSGRV